MSVTLKRGNIYLIDTIVRKNIIAIKGRDDHWLTADDPAIHDSREKIAHVNVSNIRPLYGIYVDDPQKLLDDLRQPGAERIIRHSYTLVEQLESQIETKIEEPKEIATVVYSPSENKYYVNTSDRPGAYIWQETNSPSTYWRWSNLPNDVVVKHKGMAL